jgi:arsenate reductase
MTVTIYHNPRCGKSRETLGLIEGKGIKPVVIEYLKTPPNAAEIKRLLGLLGLTARELVRKKEAADEGVSLDLPEDKLIAQMAAHPIIIERPIVVSGSKARLGRPPESVLEIL